MTLKAKHPTTKLRYKVVDTGRGICIFGMVMTHMLNWWLTVQDFWFYTFFIMWVASGGAVGFLFVSGASATLSLKRRTMELKKGDKFFFHLIRRVYFLRALLLLVVALIYNTIIAIIVGDFIWIWSWNVLQTIAISLFLTWPFIKTSKIFRIIIGIIVLVVNELILAFLLPYQGQVNFYGILFYILFNPLEQYILLPYFSMFLLGTVLGDILHDLAQIEDPQERKGAFRTHLIITSILGPTLMILGFLIIPNFERHASMGSITYGLGFLLVLYTGLLYYEIFEPIKLKEKHRFLYFYNYYSFTIYLGHNVIFFLFYRQLTVITIWIPMIITLTIISLIIIFMYKKLGAKASLKAGVSVVSYYLATNKEQRRKLMVLSKARSAAKKKQ